MQKGELLIKVTARCGTEKVEYTSTISCPFVWSMCTGRDRTYFPEADSLGK